MIGFIDSVTCSLVLLALATNPALSWQTETDQIEQVVENELTTLYQDREMLIDHLANDYLRRSKTAAIELRGRLIAASHLVRSIERKRRLPITEAVENQHNLASLQTLKEALSSAHHLAYDTISSDLVELVKLGEMAPRLNLVAGIRAIEDLCLARIREIEYAGGLVRPQTVARPQVSARPTNWAKTGPSVHNQTPFVGLKRSVAPQQTPVAPAPFRVQAATRGPNQVHSKVQQWWFVMSLHAHSRTRAMISAALVLTLALSSPVFAGLPAQQLANVKTISHEHEPIEISIKVLSGATIKVDIELSETVGGLKKKIQELTGAPSEVQQLVFGAKILKDEEQELRGLSKLQAGSSVLMVLHSERVKKADDIVEQASTTATTTAANVYTAPIFREAVATEANSGDLYYDSRNWLYVPMWGREIEDLFEPTVRLELTSSECSDLCMTMEANERKLRYGERVEVNGTYLELRAQGLLEGKFRPHRTGNLWNTTHGIRLGSTWRPEEPLIANINNYAPDNFADKEIGRLFELSARVRQQLEADARTGEGNLGLLKQRAINREVMRAYMQAVAEIPSALEERRPDKSALCAICMESFELQEPASKLACNHTLHTDCLLEWIHHDTRSDRKRAKCPYCRTEFRPPYEGLKCREFFGDE